jgi:hypothetical protein
VAAGDAFLQLSSSLASGPERFGDIERTSETLLERSLRAWKRMAQAHEEEEA